jgi:hypothetical protein
LTTRSQQRGAVLLLTVLLILMISGISFAVYLLNNAITAAAPESKTLQNLTSLEADFARFVTINRRLPCPADGRIASGAVNAGVEAKDVNSDCTATNFGVVPWVTLQINEAAATDGWGGRLTYRVPTGATGFTRVLAFDLSACSSIGTAVTGVTGGAGSAVICLPRPFPCPGAAACTSATNYTLNRGLRVNDGGGAAVMNPATGSGAAYVVISAGANVGGSYTVGGILRNVQGAALGTGETTNANNQALQAAYVDATRDNSTTTSHFDDVMLRPSISSVLTRAQLGPRP